MMMWSILLTMFIANPPVPEDYRLTEEETNYYNESSEEEKPTVLLWIYDRRDFFLVTRTAHGFIRFCKICNQIKPDRAHHCSSCGVCVLKMDHHCPWLKNCIGFSNQKVFLLSLFYCTVYCIFFIGTTLEHFVSYWGNVEATRLLPLVVGFIIAAIVGSIIGIFFVYHLSQLCKNQTTLDALQPIYFLYRHVTFDLGVYENICDVLGDKWILWLVPVFTTKGDGCTFKIHRKYAQTRSAGSSRGSVRSNISHTPQPKPSNTTKQNITESNVVGTSRNNEIISRQLSDFTL
nr:probable palmitoyltransferase ZDHHC20 [Leptinotarsa decemlineata]